LLVEDNEVNQTVGRVMLGRLGLEVSLANNGREALAAIDQACYDLVFMDCQMPEMDGYEATRSLREKERAAGSPRLPMIALTANAMIEDHERCLAAGMDGYLAKPVRLEGLCELLERWAQPIRAELKCAAGRRDIAGCGRYRSDHVRRVASVSGRRVPGDRCRVSHGRSAPDNGNEGRARAV
jgi:CheY-like chemotaxis protein